MDQISSQVRPASREASQSHTRLSCAMSWNTMWFTLGRDSLEIFPCDTAVHCGADDVGGARLLPLGRGAWAEPTPAARSSALASCDQPRQRRGERPQRREDTR